MSSILGIMPGNYIYKPSMSKSRPKRSKKTTKKIKKDLAWLKRVVASEKGILDTPISQSISANWSNVMNCFQVGQGDTLSSREGDTILATSLHFQGNFVGADDTNCLRIFVVMFESSDDSSIANVLEDYISSVGNPYLAYNSMYKVNGDCKYKKLADKRYKLNIDEAMKDINFRVDIPHNRSTMKYTSTGTAIPRTNIIAVLAVSDSLAVTHPILNLNVRQKYHK